MSEEAELRAKIAALAGRINQHKLTESNPSTPTARGFGSVPSSPRGRGHGYHPSGRGSAWAGHHTADRYAPYQQRGGYSYRPSYAPSHRNRTLVVNSTATATATAPSSQQASPMTPANPSANQWVSKRDRHMQLINTAVYDQVSQKRQQEIQATAQEKHRLRDEREKSRLMNAFQPKSAVPVPTTYGAPPPTAGTSMIREIQTNNLRFRVAADGSKLIRMFGEYVQHDIARHSLTRPDESNTDPQATPKQTKVAGVTFYRSKNGNLYRAGLVKKSMRYWNKNLARAVGREDLINSDMNRQNTVKKSEDLCPRFTATGVCALGNRCRYTHDPDKIAVCKEFLRHGRCAVGDQACNLSHDPTPHRAPACTHFLRGNCTNPDCRYAHVAVNPGAPVCRAFGSIGYCKKGAECIERHVFECPDYANTGICRNKKCRLPHVDTVGNMRKARAADNADEAHASDISSDEESYDEIDSADVDSDNLSDDEVIMTGTDDRNHELSRQQDFVSFS